MVIQLGPVTVIVAQDGTAEIASRAGCKPVTREQVRAFVDQLDLALASVDYPGGVETLVPRCLIEPLEPTAIEGVTPEIDRWRRDLLPVLDGMLCEVFSQARHDNRQERMISAYDLGAVRRFLYREATGGFWVRMSHQPEQAILGHAIQHVTVLPDDPADD